METNVLWQQWMDAKRDEMRERYHRVLPSGELIFNRFDKARYLGFGKDSSIYDTSVVMGDVKVGAHVWIGPYTILEGAGGKLVIGDWVSINSGVMIFTHDSTKHYVSGGRAPVEKGDVTINSYTVIGSGAMIRHGVTIGKHCVIGAHSMVTRDIPDYSIAVGVPAHIIGKTVLAGDEVKFEYFAKE